MVIHLNVSSVNVFSEQLNNFSECPPPAMSHLGKLLIPNTTPGYQSPHLIPPPPGPNHLTPLVHACLVPASSISHQSTGACTRRHFGIITDNTIGEILLSSKLQFLISQHLCNIYLRLSGYKHLTIMVCELSRNDSYFYHLSTEKLMKFCSHMYAHKFSDSTRAQPQGNLGNCF